MALPYIITTVADCFIFPFLCRLLWGKMCESWETVIGGGVFHKIILPHYPSVTTQKGKKLYRHKTKIKKFKEVKQCAKPRYP